MGRAETLRSITNRQEDTQQKLQMKVREDERGWDR